LVAVILPAILVGRDKECVPEGKDSYLSDLIKMRKSNENTPFLFLVDWKKGKEGEKEKASAEIDWGSLKAGTSGSLSLEYLKLEKGSKILNMTLKKMLEKKEESISRGDSMGKEYSVLFIGPCEPYTAYAKGVVEEAINAGDKIKETKMHFAELSTSNSNVSDTRQRLKETDLSKFDLIVVYYAYLPVDPQCPLIFKDIGKQKDHAPVFVMADINLMGTDHTAKKFQSFVSSNIGENCVISSLPSDKEEKKSAIRELLEKTKSVIGASPKRDLSEGCAYCGPNPCDVFGFRIPTHTHNPFEKKLKKAKA
jgi:hypothetical protein